MNYPLRPLHTARAQSGTRYAQRSGVAGVSFKCTGGCTSQLMLIGSSILAYRTLQILSDAFRNAGRAKFLQYCD